jgi:Tfp pilus assembly PilM family ATPase
MAFLDKSIRNLGSGFADYYQKNDPLLGLVFNENSIQLAEIVQSSAGRMLNKIVFWRVDNEGLDSKTLTENATFYAKQIQSALDDAKIDTAKVSVVLPIKHVQLHTIITPQFSESELEQLAQDATFFADFLEDDAEALANKAVTYQILEQDDARGESVILLGLIDKKLLDSYLEITRNAGLTPVVVDVDLLATANACWITGECKNTTQNWHGYLYYDGTKDCYIMLSDGKELRVKHCTITEADLILINQLGMLDDDSTKGQFWDELADRVSVLFLPIIEEVEKEFVVEIESLFYYVAGEESIALEKLLKDRIKGLSLQPVHPFTQLQIPSKSQKYVDAVDNQSFFAPLIGTSVRRLGSFNKMSAEQLPFRLNFSPNKGSLERAGRFSIINRFLLFGVMGFFALFLLWFSISDLPQYFLQKDQVGKYHSLNKKVESERPLILNLQQNLNNTQAQIDGLTQLNSNHQQYLNVLLLIGKLSSQTSELSEVNFVNNTFVIKGMDDSLATVLHYMAKLENNEYISKVSLAKYKGSDFELLLELR